MRKIIITALGVSLIAASTVQTAAAAERRHHARKVHHAQTNQHFRDANNSIDWPATAGSELVLYNIGN
jgi:hypothetical protein